MREISHRSGSSHQERGEFRPGHAKSKQNTARSKRAGNLGRLGDALGNDLLAAALGLTDEALRILIEGRDHAREEQYAAHLAARFKDAGIPASWLDRQYSPLAPDQLHTLRTLAAAARNKAPIRRANFRRIVAAFDGREEVLADALEMVPSAVTNVAEGRLEFDDGRFGHTNPRLMKAGFPDGWLEQAEPELPDDLLQSLEQLATDDYERTFEEGQQAQAFVSPPAAPAPAQNSQPGAATIDKTQETAMASPTRQPSKAATPQQPASAPQFKAAGMPNATRPMAHPSAGGGAKLPRSVMAAGRKLGGAAAKPAAAKTPSSPANAPQQAAAAAPAPTPSPAANAPMQSNKKAGGSAAPAPAPAAKTAERRQVAPRGTVSKEVSAARAEALEKLLDGTRRGVKVTLWRDILGSSLPFWGNIRRGAVMFRDDLAKGATEALGLPEGWLDNPTLPPPPLAAWVTDASAPVPPRMKLSIGGTQGTADTEDTAADVSAGAANDGVQQSLPLAGDAAAAGASAQDAAAAQPAAERQVKPFTHKKTPQTPKVTMSKAPSGPPVMPGTAGKPAASAKAGGQQPSAPAKAGAQAAGGGAGAGAASDTVASGGGQQSAGYEAVDARQHLNEQLAADAASAAADQAAPAAQPAAAHAPAPAPTSAASAPATAAPATAAVAAPGASQPGPLVQALLSLINAKSATGQLTEDLALDLINKLMGH